MSDTLAVDTNWLLDVALARDARSVALWEESQAERIDLFVPAICFAEAVKVLEGWEKEWRRFSAHISSFAGLGTQAALLDAGDRVADEAERRVWEMLIEVSSTATLLNLTSSTIDRARVIRDQLNLTAADSLVLALVADACEEARCCDFLSRDREFQKAETRAYMDGIGVVLWPSAASYLDRPTRNQ